ncbi:unnamed protein product [Effrenium voratum]|uniref:Uncharacterized protein n=1 Tax=Effrenium voratum TaxID=2562239 RepID=A0AA36JSH9_9DINO|nr:unnamed protein product [Effrenium voratum]
MSVAAESGHLRILQCLLKAGADKNKADNLGRSPLWFAAATDHKSCVLALLKAGANKDQMNRDGKTPLLVATACASPAVVRCLVQHGADVEMPDNFGRTPAEELEMKGSMLLAEEKRQMRRALKGEAPERCAEAAELITEAASCEIREEKNVSLCGHPHPCHAAANEPPSCFYDGAKCHIGLVARGEALYERQRNAYADLAYLNDVGYLPDGTPMHKAGNAINHPERVGADPHVDGSELPRGHFLNSVGYLPDGTPLNAAGNAINHPERMQPDPHKNGSPLPASTYAADVGYLVDGSASSGGKHAFNAKLTCYYDNRSRQAWSPWNSISLQQPEGRVCDLEYTNDVGYLPDGTPMNRAGNAINHPESIQPDLHNPGAPLPRALFANSVGYLPDGTPLNAAGNAINHPERMQPDLHNPGSPLPTSVYAADVGYLVDGTPLNAAGNNSLKGGAATQAAPVPAASMPSTPSSPATMTAAQGKHGAHGVQYPYSNQKDVYADLEYTNDVGYLPDGTPMNRAGNAINHPESIQPDLHNPGAPLPRALFANSVGYLPDGTPLNAAGNAINHPERMQPDLHNPGSPLPTSVYAADVGYLVDGTPLNAAGNNSLKGGAATQAAPPASSSMSSATASAPQALAAAAFVGFASQVRRSGGFEYSLQKDSFADLHYVNDVGYLPDGTPLNKAGNALNHPENVQPDRHTPGSPLPRANFANEVGYLPDGTPMNRAGNAINHPENIQPDPHTPGSPLPASAYAADVGYLVDGTP